MSKLPTFALGLVLLLICISPVHAQEVTNAPADTNATAATPASAAQAPDDVTNKITDLVHAGKYAEAQGLTTGLLLAYRTAKIRNHQTCNYLSHRSSSFPRGPSSTRNLCDMQGAGKALFLFHGRQDNNSEDCGVWR